MNDDLRYIIALLNIKGVGSAIARHLIEEFGSARAIFEASTDILSNIPRVGSSIIEEKDKKTIFEKADAELSFIAKHNIKPLIYGRNNYPSRLMDCPDAPALLFYLGGANLDNRHIISIVGTRNASQYGIDNVKKLIQEIKEVIPDALIVSGLALGIDVSAHKAALEFGLPTIGVVAHGLGTIYPSVHRNIAQKIIAEGGGILTEYTSETNPERGNFLARNRIIAGLADAVIVAESKETGGSLVTASIALDYNRDVFAFPGRVNDEKSKGCNRLIRLNRAGLITNANDLLEAMGWDVNYKGAKGIQRSIQFEEDKLSEVGRLIIDALNDLGDLRLSQLSEATHIEHSILLEELLDLEMGGKIRNTPGGCYQLK